MPLAPKIIAQQQATNDRVLQPMSKDARRYWRDMFDLFGTNIPILHRELWRHVLPKYKKNVDLLLTLVKEWEDHKVARVDWGRSSEKLKKVIFTLIEIPPPEVFSYVEGLAEMTTRFIIFKKEDGTDSNPTLYYGDYHITVYRWRGGYSFMINRRSDNMKRGGNKAFPTIEEAKLRACRTFLTEILYQQEN